VFIEYAEEGEVGSFFNGFPLSFVKGGATWDPFVEIGTIHKEKKYQNGHCTNDYNMCKVPLYLALQT